MTHPGEQRSSRWPARRTALLCAVMLMASFTARAELQWPQQIPADEGTIVVYQPQPERLNGNVLEGRAAMALELNGQEEPVFGAMWFSAKLDTDRDAGIAQVYDIRVIDVAWPDSRDTGEQRFTSIVEASLPESGFRISLDRLTSSLATAELVEQSLENLNTEPPEILFREELAVLLTYDGSPRMTDIENSPYARAMNAPMAVVCARRGSSCWVASGSFWYTSSDP